MDGEKQPTVAQIVEQTLPRWAELPDLELYMDQVLSLIERYLGACPGFDRKGLTASMVNNYVKLGVMPPPVRKRYTRVHLAHLVMICLLKSVLPIEVIRKLLLRSIEQRDESEVYDGFCDLFEASACRAASAEHDAGLEEIYAAALRAQAEQAAALRLCETMLK
ncbi:MAG: DUF1836 domain-containing protein [Oscillospiraceae bacterium]|nr:DUF1836 domain-containing protein [Oscillospiraceae bacterium]